MSQKITVSFVNPPREGKKQWTIKTKDNRIFGVNAGEQEQFTAGQTYEIETTSREFNGKTYHTITSAKTVSSQTTGNGAATTNGNGDHGIHWGGCLKNAAIVHSGNAVPAATIIAYARELYAAEPIVEAAKEIFNATEAPSATDDAPGDW